MIINMLYLYFSLSTKDDASLSDIKSCGLASLYSLSRSLSNIMCSLGAKTGLACGKVFIGAFDDARLFASENKI